MATARSAVRHEYSPPGLRVAVVEGAAKRVEGAAVDLARMVRENEAAETVVVFMRSPLQNIRATEGVRICSPG